ncbi:MAG: hypothetical protein WBB19_09025 [Desulforhopalus sp.]
MIGVCLVQYNAGATTVGAVLPGEHEPAGTSEKGGLTRASATRTGSLISFCGVVLFGHG